MATHKLLLLPGDGIGPEVMAEVQRLIDWLNAQGIAHFETEQGLVGGTAYDADKVAHHGCHHGAGAGQRCRDLRRGRRSEMGQVPYEARPEAGLLRLRKDMACSPICARRSAIRRWRKPPA